MATEHSLCHIGVVSYEDFAAYFSQNIFPSYFYIVILFTFVIYGAVVSAL